MSRIDHAAAAEALLDPVHIWQEHEGSTDATMLAVVLEAEVHATLALARQQQIANLIALSGYVDCDIPDDLNGIAHAALVALKGQVTELGIEVQP